MLNKTATLAHPASRNTSSKKTESAVPSVLADRSPNGQPVSEETIRLCAYRKWEAAGKPGGDGVQFWLEAERELSRAK